MADLSGIRALTFDVFGTTVDWRTGIAREAEAMLGHARARLDWVKFANRWRREYQPAMEAVRSGKRGYVPMDVLHREMLEVALAEFGGADLSGEEKDAFALGWRRLPTVAGHGRGHDAAEEAKLHAGGAVERQHRADHGDGEAGRAAMGCDPRRGPRAARTSRCPALYDSAPRLLDLEA